MHFTYRQDDTDKEIVNVENLEISKKNIAVVVPSPRKINMEKISRSPIKNKELTPSNIKTPPRRILHARIQGIVFSECPLIFTIIGFYMELDNFVLNSLFSKIRGHQLIS